MPVTQESWQFRHRESTRLGSHSVGEYEKVFLNEKHFPFFYGLLTIPNVS